VREAPIIHKETSAIRKTCNFNDKNRVAGSAVQGLDLELQLNRSPSSMAYCRYSVELVTLVVHEKERFTPLHVGF
jgi:hypothetical protein